jgi:hypothetical protein
MGGGFGLGKAPTKATPTPHWGAQSVLARAIPYGYPNWHQAAYRHF